MVSGEGCLSQRSGSLKALLRHVEGEAGVQGPAGNVCPSTTWAAGGDFKPHTSPPSEPQFLLLKSRIGLPISQSCEKDFKE